jgi:hypothetical protein
MRYVHDSSVTLFDAIQLALKQGFYVEFVPEREFQPFIRGGVIFVSAEAMELSPDIVTAIVLRLMTED